MEQNDQCLCTVTHNIFRFHEPKDQPGAERKHLFCLFFWLCICLLSLFKIWLVFGRFHTDWSKFWVGLRSSVSHNLLFWLVTHSVLLPASKAAPSAMWPHWACVRTYSYDNWDFPDVNEMVLLPSCIKIQWDWRRQWRDLNDRQMLIWNISVEFCCTNRDRGGGARRDKDLHGRIQFASLDVCSLCSH